jgi:hypothetical protein
MNVQPTYRMNKIVSHIQFSLSKIRRGFLKLIARRKISDSFPGSAAYWEQRYLTGGHSGAGSYTRFAQFKAEVLNNFVAEHHIQSVIEFGCGDGNQLRLATYPSYLGFDVSSTAISQCKTIFRFDNQKDFRLMSEYNQQRAELTLSLDVIYHLVEDRVFDDHMRALFGASGRFVIIYASNFDSPQSSDAVHVRHRQFTRWVEQKMPDWRFVEKVPNRYPYNGDYRKGSFADFYIFERSS